MRKLVCIPILALTPQSVQFPWSALQEVSTQLGQERGRAEHLQRTVHQLEAEGRETTERIEQLSAREKELSDKAREQESPCSSILLKHLKLIEVPISGTRNPTTKWGEWRSKSASGRSSAESAGT